MSRLMMLAIAIGLFLSWQSYGEKQVVPSIQKDINRSVSEGKNNIVLDNKIYRSDRELILKNLKDVTIDGNHATLIRTTVAGAIRIDSCSNLTLKNLTIDYDPLPFTQGVITEIKGTSVFFRIDEGYPKLTPPYTVRHALYFEPDGKRWKQIPAFYGPTIISSPDEGYCCYDRYDRLPPSLRKGDRIALNIRSHYGIFIEASARIKLENVKILTAPGCAILSRFGTGDDVFHRIVIGRGPAPSRNAPERLISSCADGFNYAYSRKGPLVEECTFSYMGDDSVNLHSVAFPIISQIDKRTFDTIRQFQNERFPAIIHQGDEVRILSPRRYDITGKAAIISIRKSPRQYTVDDVNRFYGKNWNGKKFAAYEITVDRDLESTPGFFFDIPAIAASNFIIRNNHFHDHMARGIRIMASQGLIENNLIERTKHAGISIGCEYGYWREAGWVENIVIRRNRLIDIGQGALTLPESYAPGAIAVFAKLEDYSGDFRGNRNIVIENNIVSGSEGAGIFINRASAVKLRNNHLEKVLQSGKSGGEQYQLGTASPVWIIKSSVAQE